MSNEKDLNMEKATLYVELSKEKIDSIWKRRGVAWRTCFVLWAGLGAVLAAVYKESGNISIEIWGWILFIFGVIFVLHAWHWIGAHVSDEMGFSWAHYYQEQAEIYMGLEIAKEDKLKRPSPTEGWRHHLFAKHKSFWQFCRKLHAIIPQVLMTASLMILVLLIFNGKISKQTNGDKSNASILHTCSKKLRTADVHNPAIQDINNISVKNPAIRKNEILSKP